MKSHEAQFFSASVDVPELAILNSALLSGDTFDRLQVVFQNTAKDSQGNRIYSRVSIDLPLEVVRLLPIIAEQLGRQIPTLESHELPYLDKDTLEELRIRVANQNKPLAELLAD